MVDRRSKTHDEAVRPRHQNTPDQGQGFLSGGETEALINSTDWSVTPLGSRDAWPESLRAVVNLVLASSFPMAILWGSDLIFIYNDAYRIIAADRHPDAMGRSTREVWPEAWEFNKPIFERVMTRGETVHFEDQLFRITRNSRMEDAYFTLSYSPIRSDAGEVAGTLVILVETTQQIRAKKELKAAHKNLEKRVEERTAELRAEVTERKRVEEESRRLLAAVQEEKDRLSALVNSIQDEVWFADMDKNFTLANPSALREFCFGAVGSIDVEKMAASLEVHRPDGTPRPVEEAPPLRALKGEVVRNQEEIIRTPPSGELRYREVSSAPVRDAGGNIVGSVSVVRDITERKRMEEALRDSERLYRAIGESIDYGVWVCAPDGRNIYASESFLKMVGMTQEQCSNFGWGDVLHPDDAERTIEAWKECVEAGGTWDIEHRFRGVDGQWHPILARGVPVKNERGEIIYWAGINLDISRIKDAEKRLMVSEATMEAFFDASPGILNIEDEEFTYIKTDRMTPTYFGLDRQSIIGKAVKDLAPEFIEENGAMMTRVIESGQAEVNVEVKSPLLSRPGETAYWQASYFPVPLPNGKRGIGVVGVEITEIKKAEEALKRAHDELELRIDERTSELSQAYETLRHETEERMKAEEHLRQSQKMEAIGTLAGGIAHDFNNILAAILGFTEMAVDDVQDRPLVEKNLKNVLKSAMRARDLVKQILAFSRKTSYERTPLSLTPLIKETLQLLRASVPTTIEIRLTNTASSDAVLAAPVEVQQILMNLATNASLAMQEKGGTMEISLTDLDFTPDSPVLEPDVMPGEYLQLAVRDTGIGMSPDVMKRVFEPFFTTREVGQGSGMGLSVVYGIVKDLQGTITVESVPGAGSTFRVFLPKAKSEAEEAHAQAGPVSGGNERILFVDDDPMLVEWGQNSLERLGYTVTASTEGEDALKAFASDPFGFDLVITDQTMSGLTGYQLAKKLLRIRGDIPIILCTGHSETVSPDIAKEAGIREYLMKPLAKQELAEAVRRVLDADKEE